MLRLASFPALALGTTLFFTLLGCEPATIAQGGGGQGGSTTTGTGTTTSTGGTGGQDTGGPCQSSDDCVKLEYCRFADHACGQGETTGVCSPVPLDCGFGFPIKACACDGTVQLQNCPELNRTDFTTPDKCAVPDGMYVCDLFYCPIPESCNGTATCACLLPVTACNGATCSTDAEGHVIVKCGS